MGRFSVERKLLACAALCPFLLIVGGLTLANGYIKSAGFILFLAGAIDLLGYSTALLGVKLPQESPDA